MDNNTPLTPNENSGSKSTVIILISIAVIICILTICGGIAIYYGFSTFAPNASAPATEALIPNLPFSVTETSIPNVPEISHYEFFDDFEDNSNQWFVDDGENEYWSGEVVVKDGAYVWDIQEFHQDLFVSTWRTYAESPVVQDFDLTVDAKLLTPESDQLCYAVVFHATPGENATNGYEFHVCDTREFFVGYYTDDESKSKDFVQWTASNAIRSGDWNTLGVNARGDDYTLSINGEVVFELTDTASPSGSVYLLVRYYETTPGTVLFDNFGFQPR